MVTEKVSENGATTKRVEFLYDAFNQRTGKRLDSPSTIETQVAKCAGCNQRTGKRLDTDGNQIQGQVFDEACYQRTGKRLDSDGNGTWDRFEIFVWTDGHEMMRFIDSDGEQSTEPYRLANRYLWGPMVDQILADEQFAPGTGPLFNATTGSSTSGTTLWTLSDHLGSVRDLVDNNGVIRKHRVYSSFGQIINEVNYNSAGQVISNTDPAAVDAVFAYTARALDPDLQSQTHRNRWYTPSTARWLSQDPISFAGGDANLYRYVGNRPTRYRDANGLDWLDSYAEKFNSWFGSGYSEYTGDLIRAGLNSVGVSDETLAHKSATELALWTTGAAAVVAVPLVVGGEVVLGVGSFGVASESVLAAEISIAVTNAANHPLTVSIAIGAAETLSGVEGPGLGIDDGVRVTSKVVSKVVDATCDKARPLVQAIDEIPVPSAPKGGVPGSYRPSSPLVRDTHGNMVPSSLFPHTQLGTEVGRKVGPYTAAREFGENGQWMRDIHFTDHGRPNIPGHVNPHQHLPIPNGGTPGYGPATPYSW